MRLTIWPCASGPWYSEEGIPTDWTLGDGDSFRAPRSCQEGWQTQAMRYTRIYNGDDGTSRLEHGEILFASEVFAPPAPPMGVSPTSPAQAVMFIRLPTGWTDAAHPAPARQWMFILSGRGQVSASGKTMHWGAGDALLVEDTAPPGHATTVHDEAVVAVVRL